MKIEHHRANSIRALLFILVIAGAPQLTADNAEILQPSKINTSLSLGQKKKREATLKKELSRIRKELKLQDKRLKKVEKRRLFKKRYALFALLLLGVSFALYKTWQMISQITEGLKQAEHRADSAEQMMHAAEKLFTGQADQYQKNNQENRDRVTELHEALDHQRAHAQTEAGTLQAELEKLQERIAEQEAIFGAEKINVRAEFSKLQAEQREARAANLAEQASIIEEIKKTGSIIQLPSR